MSLNFDILKKLTSAVSSAGNAGNGELTVSQSDLSTLCRDAQELHDSCANKDAEYTALMGHNERHAAKAKEDAEALRLAGIQAESDAKKIAELEAKVAELTPKTKAKKGEGGKDGEPS